MLAAVELHLRIEEGFSSYDPVGNRPAFLV